MSFEPGDLAINSYGDKRTLVKLLKRVRWQGVWLVENVKTGSHVEIGNAWLSAASPLELLAFSDSFDSWRGDDYLKE